MVIKKSKASFKLKDVRGFIYGGVSSRFWILRKHMNSMNLEDFKVGKVEFYAWMCVTV